MMADFNPSRPQNLQQLLLTGFNSRVDGLKQQATSLVKAMRQLIQDYHLPADIELNSTIGFQVIFDEPSPTEPIDVNPHSSEPLSTPDLAAAAVQYILVLGQNGQRFTNTDLRNAMLHDGFAPEQLPSERVNMATRMYISGLTLTRTPVGNSTKAHTNSFVISGQVEARPASRQSPSKTSKKASGHKNPPKAAGDDSTTPSTRQLAHGEINDLIVGFVANSPGIKTSELRKCLLSLGVEKHVIDKRLISALRRLSSPDGRLCLNRSGGFMPSTTK